MIIKTAPKARFENERDVLRRLRSQSHIRQLLDETQDPPSLVLQHLDDNLLDASNKETLEGLDVKFVAKRILQALQALHEDGYTHTGMFANLFQLLTQELIEINRYQAQQYSCELQYRFIKIAVC